MLFGNKTVAKVLSTLHRALDKLEALQTHHENIAAVAYDQIESLRVKAKSCEAEAAKAARVASRIKELLA